MQNHALIHANFTQERHQVSKINRKGVIYVSIEERSTLHASRVPHRDMILRLEKYGRSPTSMYASIKRKIKLHWTENKLALTKLFNDKTSKWCIPKNVILRIIITLNLNR